MYGININLQTLTPLAPSLCCSPTPPLCCSATVSHRRSRPPLFQISPLLSFFISPLQIVDGATHLGRALCSSLATRSCFPSTRLLIGNICGCQELYPKWVLLVMSFRTWILCQTGIKNRRVQCSGPRNRQFSYHYDLCGLNRNLR